MDRSGPTPVMHDVARRAGVSHQTVSRVINNSPNVSGPTRAKVLAAMAELEYRPNAVARALASRRSGTVGVATFDTVLHGPISTLYAVVQAASAHGLGTSVAVVDAPRSAVDPDAVTRAVRRLTDQSVEGIIVLAPHRDAVRALAPRFVPTVVVGGASAPGTPTVGIDQFGGAVAATRHLLDLGHRVVHHLAGPPGWLDAEQRRAGWRAALEASGAGLPAPVQGDWSVRSGYAAMRALLAADPGLTAVFVANDQMALGALSALRAAGRPVPADVSVVGFDDVAEAEFYQPPLTTVGQNFAEAGARAVEVLLDLIRPTARAGTEPAGATLVATELVIRSSTSERP